MNYQEIFLIHVIEFHNEIKINKEEEVILDDCMLIMDEFNNIIFDEPIKVLVVVHTLKCGDNSLLEEKK